CVGKRAEIKSVRTWVIDGEWEPKGKGISIEFLIGGGEDGCSSMGGGDDGCSFVGGGDKQAFSACQRGTASDRSLGGEAK
ncbi:hypothetical protein KI387_012784, partial [Taxus chinensis]